MADANIIVKIVDQTRGGIGSVSSEVDKLDRKTTGLGGSMDSLQKKIVAVGAAIATSFAVKFIVDATTQFEDLQDTLDTVAGSATAGAEAFDFLAKFATTTQFGVNDLAETFIKLKTSGIEPTEALLTTFTDTAAVTTDQIGTLQAITDLFSRTTSGGLGLEELNRLADRGVPVFRLLEEQLGITRLEVSEFGKTSEGARQITEALITGLNQEFGGATQNRLDNLSTALSNFGIAAELAAAEFGKGFAPALTEATNALTAYIQENDETIAAMGRLVGEGITFLVENIELVTIAAGAMIAAFSVNAIAGIVTSITTLTTAVTALNTVILANPIARVITLMITAITGVYIYWDELKELVVGVFDAMQVAGLEFVKYLTEGLEATINGLINGFENFGTKTIAIMKAIGKSILDPTNATEIFREELAKAEKQIEANTDKTVDFSDTIESLDKRIIEATGSTEDNSDATGDNTDEKSDNEDQTEDTEKATKNFRNETENTTEAVDKNTQALMEQYKAYGESRIAADKATRAIQEQIKAIDNETTSLGLNNRDRRLADELIKAQEESMTALTGTTWKASEDHRAAIMEMVKNDTYHTEELDGLIASQIEDIESSVDAYYQAEEDREKVRETTRERERALSDFVKETERLNQSYYEATTSKVQQLEDEKNAYLSRARELNLEDAKSTQDALLEYERAINEQRVKDHEDMLKEQEKALQDFKSEYNLIYDDIYGVIEDWTGLSSRELERYNQYAKLLLGTDILGAVDNFVTRGLLGISGFNQTGSEQMGEFAYNSSLYTTNAGNYIGQDIFGNYLPTTVGGFVNNAGILFGSQGGGLLGMVTGLFGGLGATLTDLFNYVFSGIGTGLGSVGGLIGNLFGAGFDFLGGLGSSILDIGSSLLGGVVDFFSGFFAEGGYIRPGSFGIVGEAGPEIVRGPAQVYSNEDSMGMMGGGNVNVNFTINAVDAKGIDQLLVERKPLITNIVRNAVAQQGRRV